MMKMATRALLKAPTLRTVALALGLALAAQAPVQAAGWSLLSPGYGVDFLDQSGQVGGQAAGTGVLGALQDLSAPGQVLLADSVAGQPEAVGSASVEQGHSLLVSVDTQLTPGTVDVMLSAAQYWNVAATQGTEVSGFNLTQDLALGGLRLLIVGDAGEAVGTRVRVSFSGSADALFGGLAGQGEIGLSLDISRGADSLARHDSLWSDSGSQQIQLSFEAVVGDELVLTLAAHQQLTQGAPVWLGAGQGLAIDRSGLLQGQLTVAAVPEPQSLAMLLAGAVVIGGVLRRRARQG
ncbi:MAG: PEP-CTERM sorting domain-containing protein [Aquabacterium sp.]|jgi:hypothetical protein|uniref:PEP-CTERM sorting domain-containing protein n=1 Tax=Aquabacterium sp. TaxID=1872578 RepID=UPI003BB13A18